MKSKYRQFVLLKRIFQPWQWKRRKKRNRLKTDVRTLQRKISIRSTKDPNLLKKDVLMPVKHNVFLWNLPDVEEGFSSGLMEIPLRTAYGQAGRCGIQQSQQAVFARAHRKAAELKLL
ncbi:hypothetical protein TNCV_1271291 [Trichonephila clavipes]|nr:hypothetical protein TNCV_1271291 [Trichonephila clavipes]